MIKEKFKSLSLILVSLLVIPSFSPILANSESDLNSGTIIESEDTRILDDTPEENEALDVSQPNKDFDPDAFETENGLSVAPLEIKQPAFSPRVRSSYYPAKFDLRSFGMVSPVKDQGPNGSCWAFATYGSMESILLRQKKGLFDFSEKHLRNMHGFDWSAEKGGNRDMAAAYLASGKGPILEDDDPYDPVITVSKKDLRRALDIDKVIYLPDVTNINEIDNIKWAINEYGGVYTTINSSSYYENKNTNSMYNPGHGTPNHAVTIVGWDDTFPSTAFTQHAPGNGAWICKNSWGTNYLDNGYYYVSYYDGFVGKSPTVFIPRKKDIRGIIHQYDPFGATRSVGFKGEGFMTNIFTSDYKELLHQVGLFNVSNQCDYDVYIVRNISRTSQLSEEKIKIASGSFLYPGYYTVDVEPQQLEEGEQFAIIVYMNGRKSNNNTPLPIETRIKGYTSNAVASPGQSFFSKTGSGWTDLTSTLPQSNFCIKAITTTGSEVPDKDLEDKDDHGKDITIDGKTKIRNIVFNMGSQGVIDLDKKGILRYTIEPENAEDVELEFGSLDKDVAVFKEGGILYPVKPGNTNVYIKTKDGSLEARFNVQVVNPGIRIPGRNQIETIGENDYVPEPDVPEPGDDDTVPDDKKPDPIKPDLDPDVAIKLYMNITSDIGTVGTTFNVEPLVGTYPSTAKRNFVYYSDKPNVVEARPDGILVLHKIGYANITVMTDNGLKTTFRMKVIPDKSKQEIKIVDFKNSKRSSGIFHLYANATIDDKPYNGPADITVESEGRVKQNRVYFNAGKIDLTYTGGDFGVWREKFTATLKIRNIEKTIKFGKNGEPIDEFGHEPEFSDIQIVDFSHGKRVGGLFHVNGYVTNNGNPYNGEGELTVESEENSKSVIVKIRDGKFDKAFNATHFPSRNKFFTATIRVDNVSDYQSFIFDGYSPREAKIEIKSLFNSKRKPGGIFTIGANITADGKPYTGMVKLTTSNPDGHKIEDEFEVRGGRLEKTYNGAQFGVWRDDFTTTLTVRGIEKTIDYTFNETKLAYGSHSKIDIKNFVNSEKRTAGVFHLYFEVYANGEPFNGVANIKTVSGDHEQNDEVTIKNGKGEITYTGFEFGVWRKDFTSTLDVLGNTEVIRFGYK